jgi:hypothetical protein
MMDVFENYHVPQDESKLEFLFHLIWSPELQYIKIQNFIYAIEHTEDFLRNILKMENFEEKYSEIVKEFLMVEIVVTTMFICETFAAIAKACSTNPKNIQKVLKEFNATKFYSDFDSETDDSLFADMLCVPNLDLIEGEESKRELETSIKEFREAFMKIREYYFSNLDLFNAYKHGLRIFPFETLDENGNPYAVIAYFAREHKPDAFTIRRMGRDYYKHQTLAIDMLYFIRIMLSNHRSKLESPEKWEITIPRRSELKFKE